MDAKVTNFAGSSSQKFSRVVPEGGRVLHEIVSYKLENRKGLIKERSPQNGDVNVCSTVRSADKAGLSICKNSSDVAHGTSIPEFPQNWKVKVPSLGRDNRCGEIIGAGWQSCG